MKFSGIIIAMFMLAGALFAQEPSLGANFTQPGPDPVWLSQGAQESAQRAAQQPEHKALWKASLIAVIAASAMDAQSSWGKLEANPLLANSAGRFGSRGVALKGMLAGSIIGAQWIATRHNPKAVRYATIGNFAMAAFYAKVAVHNYGNSR